MNLLYKILALEQSPFDKNWKSLTEIQEGFRKY